MKYSSFSFCRKNRGKSTPFLFDHVTLIDRFDRIFSFTGIDMVSDDLAFYDLHFTQL